MIQSKSNNWLFIKYGVWTFYAWYQFMYNFSFRYNNKQKTKMSADAGTVLEVFSAQLRKGARVHVDCWIYWGLMRLDVTPAAIAWIVCIWLTHVSWSKSRYFSEIWILWIETNDKWSRQQNQTRNLFLLIFVGILYTLYGTTSSLDMPVPDTQSIY